MRSAIGVHWGATLLVGQVATRGRLDAGDARATGLDPDATAYTALGDLDGASDKAIRDAGAIPVAAI